MVDDRGGYRIAGLPPGTYRLSVRITEAFFNAHATPGAHVSVTLSTPRPGTAELIVFAPDSLKESSARLVTVGDGDEITAADITVPARLLHSIGAPSPKADRRLKASAFPCGAPTVQPNSATLFPAWTAPTASTCCPPALTP
jgi:hypothetical protein